MNKEYEDDEHGVSWTYEREQQHVIEYLINLGYYSPDCQFIILL